MPENVAKASQAQTWHTSRGEQIKSKEVQDLEVAGYRKVDLDRESAPRTVKLCIAQLEEVRLIGVDTTATYQKLVRIC